MSKLSFIWDKKYLNYLTLHFALNTELGTHLVYYILFENRKNINYFFNRKKNGKVFLILYWSNSIIFYWIYVTYGQ